jgi:flagellar motor switch protein FliN/FliY
MAEFEEAKFNNLDKQKVEITINDTKSSLGDVYLPVSIELARTQLFIKEVLELEVGSIIEFDKLAGETVDLLVNDKKFAEGEVVVIDEHFGIRITNLVSTIDVELESR